MKAYNPQWSVNDLVQETSQNWVKKGFLNKNQMDEIKKTYSSNYYKPNVFLKIGLFIFTILAASFASGSLSALFLSIFSVFENETNLQFIFLSLIVGLIYLFALEQLIKANKLYHSGIDNALIYMTLGAFCTVVILFFKDLHFPFWAYCGLLFPIFVAASIRYADVLVTSFAYLLALSILAGIFIESALGKNLLPFIVMGFSGVVYFAIQKLKLRTDYLYYENCLNILKMLTLITFYLGGNYLIVREGNAQINEAPKSYQIAFAPLFYFFTAVIPFAYIYFGLLKKDRLMMILGLFAIGFSIFTYRFYLSLLPIEIALTLGGAVLIALAGGCMYYLRSPKHGFTQAPDDEKNSLNLESMVMSQMVQNAIPQQGDTLRFGGGDTGGGGAGGEY
jgi:hypothetical protein